MDKIKLKTQGFSTTEVMIGAVIFLLVALGGYNALLSVTTNQTFQSNLQKAHFITTAIKSILTDKAGSDEFDKDTFTGDYKFCYSPGTNEHYEENKDTLIPGCKNYHFEVSANVGPLDPVENYRLVVTEIKWPEGPVLKVKNSSFRLMKSRKSSSGHRLVVKIIDANGEGVDGILVTSVSQDDIELSGFTNHEGITFLEGIKRSDQLNDPINITIEGNQGTQPYYYFRGPDINQSLTVWESRMTRVFSVQIPTDQLEFDLNNDPAQGVGDIVMTPFGKIQGRVTDHNSLLNSGVNGVGIEVRLLKAEIPGLYTSLPAKTIEITRTIGGQTGSWGGDRFYPPGFYTVTVLGSVEVNSQNTGSGPSHVLSPDFRDPDSNSGEPWPVTDYDANNLGYYSGVNNPGSLRTLPATQTTCDECIRVEPWLEVGGQMVVYDSEQHPSGFHDHTDANAQVNHDALNSNLNTHFELIEKPSVRGELYLATYAGDRFISSGVQADSQKILNLEVIHNSAYPADVETTDVKPINLVPANPQIPYPTGGTSIVDDYFRINTRKVVGTRPDANGNFSFLNIGLPDINSTYRFPTNTGGEDTQFDQKMPYIPFPYFWDAPFAPALILTHPDDLGGVGNTVPQNGARQIYVLWLGPNGNDGINHGEVSFGREVAVIPSGLAQRTYQFGNNHRFFSGFSGNENFGTLPGDYFVGDMFVYDILNRLTYIQDQDITDFTEGRVLALARADLGTITGNILNAANLADTDPNNDAWFYTNNLVANSQDIPGRARTLGMEGAAVPGGAHMDLGHSVQTEPDPGANPPTHTFTFNGTVLPSLVNYRRDHTNEIPLDYVDSGTAPDPIRGYDWMDSFGPGGNFPNRQVHYSDGGNHLDAVGNHNERYVFFTLDETANTGSFSQFLKVRVTVKTKPDPTVLTGTPDSLYLDPTEVQNSGLSFLGYDSGLNQAWAAAVPIDNPNGTIPDTDPNNVAVRLQGQQVVPQRSVYRAVSDPIVLVPGNPMNIDIRVNDTPQNTNSDIYLRVADESTYYDVTRRKEYGNGRISGTRSSFCADPGCDPIFDAVFQPQELQGYYEGQRVMEITELGRLPYVQGYVYDPDGVPLEDIRVIVQYKRNWRNPGNNNTWITFGWTDSLPDGSYEISSNSGNWTWGPNDTNQYPLIHQSENIRVYFYSPPYPASGTSIYQVGRPSSTVTHPNDFRYHGWRDRPGIDQDMHFGNRPSSGTNQEDPTPPAF